MPKILIVDDEKDSAYIIGKILELKGYEVESVNSGYEAIEKTKKTQFDLCLLDIKLPDINGVEVFLNLKEVNSHIRVIMMTGFAVEQLIEKAIKQGAYACIHKPFDMEKLFELIKEALRYKKRVILIANNVEKVQQTIRSFFKDKDYTIYEAKTGQEVIERVKERYYDLILLDYGLPDMDGISVFKGARKVDPAIVAILMLDKTLEMLAKDALKEGFYGCITKPIDINKFIEMMKEVLKNGE